MSDPAIELRGLSKIYPSTQAGVAPVVAQVRKSEWVALLGPSGSGKSTLLKLLAGIETGSGGTLQNPYTRAQTGFVFQEAALLPWKTVEENILLPVQLRSGGASVTQARKQAEPWIEKLRLQNFLKSYPEELSGGLKMRVSIARALIAEPKLLLLDEPFAALDEPIRIELGLELRELWKQFQPTVFMVTHSITEALWLADRVMVLQGQPGRVVLDEPLAFGVDRPLSIRGTPQFLEQVQKCFQLLRGTTK